MSRRQHGKKGGGRGRGAPRPEAGERPGKGRRREKLVVAFDEAERQAFVGGFHKRKVERREYAQLKAREKERRDRIEERAARRAEERARNEAKLAELRERMAAAAPRGADEHDEGAGAHQQKPPRGAARKQQQVFIDGERMVTVTVAGMEDYDSSD